MLDPGNYELPLGTFGNTSPGQSCCDAITSVLCPSGSLGELQRLHFDYKADDELWKTFLSPLLSASLSKYASERETCGYFQRDLLPDSVRSKVMFGIS